jgi:hypothetical protein
MSRYRKTMAQAMNEGAIQMQIATLKKAYEPMRNKRISLDNANKLSQIFNRFDSNKEMLKQLYKADIPFVSAMATSRLISKHNMKAQELMQIRKEGIETSTDELKQINEHFLSEGVGHISGFRNDKEKANMISLAKQHGLKIDDSGSKLKLSGNMRKILDLQLAAQKNGLKAEEVRLSLDEGKMSQIDQMQKDGKSAAEIAKLMKLDVKTVKSILGEVKEDKELEEINNMISELGYGQKLQKVYVKRDGSDFNVFYRGRTKWGTNKQIGYFHRIGSKLSVYHDNENDEDDFTQNDMGFSVQKAIGIIFDTADDNGVIKEDLEEEKLHEFKKMTVTFKSMADMAKASTDLAKHGFTIDAKGMVMKVDGKGADLNKYATDLKNFYKASIRAESYTIDESADEDFYNPVTEACWTGYKQVGMKDKGGKQVPNCVPEETVKEDKKKMKKADVEPDNDAVEKNIKEEEDPNKLANELKQKENEIAQLKQKAETEKAKNVQKSTQKMVNPETGEPLLQVGIAYKHLKQKIAKDAAAKDDAEEKEKEEKKKTLLKFKDRIKEEALNESEASDKAKAMGLDYMKFGRYGKDGKVTHKTVGDTLQKVDDKGEPVKDDEPKKDEPSKTKDEPKADVKPKVDPFDAQKDLEDMVTDGMIDVEDDGQGGLTATKEYEPSQDYEAERDVKSIKQYFKDKGIDEKDIYVDVESEEDYIQVNVEIRGKKVEESADYLKPRMNPSQLANIKNVWKHKTKKDVTPAVKQMIKNMDVPTQLAIKDAGINLLSDLVEVTKDGAYAIGMSAAKKKYNDEPPLDKKTITKGHEIAKSILKKEETIIEFTSQQIKQAYGIANDPRYKQGNYTGAVAAIEKLAKGLSRHPDVQKVLKRTNENAEHPAKKVFEQIEGLKNKADKSGMPYSILKKVYDRGMAAWRGGHRPGASQQQWAFARVNSFITKSSGTWGGADKDLAAKVKGK